MLDHSRASSGQKVETDINVLCDEYLRLAYHGIKAKDRNFNADFALDLDPSLPKIKVISQDIGRVLLNLINNAFQAVSTDIQLRQGSVGQGGQRTADSPKVSKSPNPKVIVSTMRVVSPLGAGGSDDAIQISVSDNGPGIPDEIKDKIFQPFFTTKPTGEGTGLGLSLAYDIVKAHGGELKVNTHLGEGSEFIIILPLTI
jgi:signal transduction histidine kinase